MNQVAPKHPCLRRLSLPAGLDSRINAAGIKQPIQASGARRREDGSPRGPRHVVTRFTTSVREAARPSGHGELRAFPSHPRTLEASFLLEGASMNQWQSLYSSCERAPMKDRTPLLSLSTVADAKISNPPWVNFQSAGSVFNQRQQVTILVDGDELINSVNTDHIGKA